MVNRKLYDEVIWPRFLITFQRLSRPMFAHAALDQEIAYRANVVLIWTAVFARSKWKYKERAYRYAYLDCGHIAENVALAAVALES